MRVLQLTNDFIVKRMIEKINQYHLNTYRKNIQTTKAFPIKPTTMMQARIIANV